MKASRRGFLGGMLGTAVAGPSLAASAAQQMIGGSATNTVAASSLGRGWGYASGNVGGQDESRDYLLGRLHRIRGMSLEDRREQYGTYREDVNRADVVALRSVSEVQKVRMIYDREVERRAARDLASVLRELAGLDQP